MSADWMIDAGLGLVSLGLTLGLLFGVWGLTLAAEALARRLLKRRVLAERRGEAGAGGA